jgi:hypothetical protein
LNDESILKDGFNFVKLIQGKKNRAGQKTRPIKKVSGKSLKLNRLGQNYLAAGVVAATGVATAAAAAAFLWWCFFIGLAAGVATGVASSAITMAVVPKNATVINIAKKRFMKRLLEIR